MHTSYFRHRLIDVFMNKVIDTTDFVNHFRCANNEECSTELQTLIEQCL